MSKRLFFGLAFEMILTTRRAWKIQAQPQVGMSVLTLDEASTLLKISNRTLQRLIKAHQVPAFKVGGQWRIQESKLKKWMDTRTD
jgi:excisionase family DNA binding protein